MIDKRLCPKCGLKTDNPTDPVGLCPKCLADAAATTDNGLNTANPVEEKESPGKPWGFWLTILFSFPIMVFFIIIQTVVAVLFVLVEIFLIGGKQNPADFEQILSKIESNGLFMSVATCLCAILCMALMAVFIFLRKGIKIREYLCLNKISVGETFKWASILLIFVFCQDALTFLLGKPIVVDVMLDAYKTCLFPPFLIFAIVVAAPLFEEFFFRGFLFIGIQNSRLGSWGAAIITSLLWAAIHQQYDLYGIIQIFASGLLLSYAKVRSGSLYPCIIMHSLMNLVATIEVIVKLKML